MILQIAPDSHIDTHRIDNHPLKKHKNQRSSYQVLTLLQAYDQAPRPDAQKSNQVGQASIDTCLIAGVHLSDLGKRQRVALVQKTAQKNE